MTIYDVFEYAVANNGDKSAFGERRVLKVRLLRTYVYEPRETRLSLSCPVVQERNNILS